MNDKDRVQYAHSVETGPTDYITAFTQYFDQLMGIYSVIRPCNYVTEITGLAANCFSAIIHFEDIESCSKAADVLGNLGMFNIYGRQFSIDKLTPDSDGDIALDIIVY